MESKKQTKLFNSIILWLDKELNLSDEEYRELVSIQELTAHYNSMVIPHSVLPRKRIDLKKSTLLKKLIKHGYCSLGLSEIEIRPKKITINEYEQFIEYLESIYTGLLSTEYIQAPFPSSVFTIIEKSIYDININDLSSYNPKKLSRKEGIIRLIFDDVNIPDIICLGSHIENLKDICFFKLREHLSDLAAENPDYYSEKIQLYKKRFRGRNLELIEMDIGKLTLTTEKQTRKAIAKIVLNRINHTEDEMENFLIDTISSENNFILTRFYKDNRRDFDFFQSLLLLYKGIYSKSHHHTVNNSSLLQAVKQSLSGFVTVSELKTSALKANPELREDEYDKIFSDFEKTYIGLGTNLPIPMIMKQSIIKGSIKEEYLIHAGNIDSFFETRLIKASEDIKEIVKRDWKNKLQKHSFDESMFSDSIFRKKLEYYLEENFFTLFCFMRNDHLDSFLLAAGLLSPRTKLLKEYGFDRLDQCLKINRQEIYDLINQSLLSPMSQFTRLIFKFIQWFFKSIYLRKPVKERKLEALSTKSEIIEIPENPSVTPVTVKVHRVLRNCGCTSEEELKEKITSLWSSIPEKNLQRDDVEQNVLRDLNSYFADKEVVYYSTLEFMIDTNLNRILSKASHLIPYSETLREFIIHQICYCIYVDSYMRNKIRFKKS